MESAAKTKYLANDANDQNQNDIRRCSSATLIFNPAYVCCLWELIARDRDFAASAGTVTWRWRESAPRRPTTTVTHHDSWSARDTRECFEKDLPGCVVGVSHWKQESTKHLPIVYSSEVWTYLVAGCKLHTFRNDSQNCVSVYMAAGFQFYTFRKDTSPSLNVCSCRIQSKHLPKGHFAQSECM